MRNKFPLIVLIHTCSRDCYWNSGLMFWPTSVQLLDESWQIHDFFECLCNNLLKYSLSFHRQIHELFTFTCGAIHNFHTTFKKLFISQGFCLGSAWNILSLCLKCFRPSQRNSSNNIFVQGTLHIHTYTLVLTPSEAA